VVGEIVFFVLAAVAVGTALGLLLARNVIHSALFLVANFITIAVLYLNLGAPLIAFTQVTVYAGAIMVLFLFVIMLLGGEAWPLTPQVKSRRVLPVLLVIVILGEVGLVLLRQASTLPLLEAPAATFGAPREIGLLLFTQYLLPVEITALVVVSAMVGAIVLTRAEDFATQKSKPTHKENLDGTGH
jgi:NADH-quinone oxidoreductase subunit J